MKNYPKIGFCGSINFWSTLFKKYFLYIQIKEIFQLYKMSIHTMEKSSEKAEFFGLESEKMRVSKFFDQAENFFLV